MSNVAEKIPVETRVRVLEETLLSHANAFNDIYASGIAGSLLFATSEAQGYSQHEDWSNAAVLIRARKAAQILSILPEDADHNVPRRHEQRSMSETKKLLWKAVIRGLRCGCPSEKSLAIALLAQRSLTLGERKTLRECMREEFEELTTSVADGLKEVLRNRPKEYEPLVFRAIFTAIANKGSLEFLEGLVDA